MGTPFQSRCRFLSPVFSPESSERNALNNKNTRIACKCQPTWARGIFNEIFFWLGAEGGGWWAWSLAVVAGQNRDVFFFFFFFFFFFTRSCQSEKPILQFFIQPNVPSRLLQMTCCHSVHFINSLHFRPEKMRCSWLGRSQNMFSHGPENIRSSIILFSVTSNVPHAKWRDVWRRQRLIQQLSSCLVKSFQLPSFPEITEK